MVIALVRASLRSTASDIAPQSAFDPTHTGPAPPGRQPRQRKTMNGDHRNGPARQGTRAGGGDEAVVPGRQSRQPARRHVLRISGLDGFENDGKTMPESFEEQGDLIWKHLRTILRSAGMDVSNLVSLRTYLADPEYDEANARMREKQLGSHRVAATVVCCRLLEPAWKLQIEAVAAA
jgi:enamine deaminase RidA (YjgF/YER057c/UK114 family)